MAIVSGPTGWITIPHADSGVTALLFCAIYAGPAATKVSVGTAIGGHIAKTFFDADGFARRRREGDAANVSSAFVFVFVFVSASAAGASRFANPHTRSSVSAISIEPSTRCIALDALSYGR